MYILNSVDVKEMVQYLFDSFVFEIGFSPSLSLFSERVNEKRFILPPSCPLPF